MIFFVFQDDVNEKINKAYCPPRTVEGNPCLEYVKYIVLPRFNEFKVENEKNGGNKWVAGTKSWNSWLQVLGFCITFVICIIIIFLVHTSQTDLWNSFNFQDFQKLWRHCCCLREWRVASWWSEESLDESIEYNSASKYTSFYHWRHSQQTWASKSLLKRKVFFSKFRASVESSWNIESRFHSIFLWYSSC